MLVRGFLRSPLPVTRSLSLGFVQSRGFAKKKSDSGRVKYPKWKTLDPSLSPEEVEQLRREEEEKTFEPPSRHPELEQFIKDRDALLESTAEARSAYPDFEYNTFEEMKEGLQEGHSLNMIGIDGQEVDCVDYFKTGTIVFFGGPGLSEPEPLNNTSVLMIEDFVAKYDALKGKGVDKLAFMSHLATRPLAGVRDIARFSRDRQCKDKVEVFMDNENGLVTYATGVAVDLSELRLWRWTTRPGLEFRARPFSMIIKDGKIEKRNVSEDVRSIETVNADTVLSQL